MSDYDSDLLDLRRCLKRANRILAEPGRPGDFVAMLSTDPLMRRRVNVLAGILQDCARQASEIAGEPVDAFFAEKAAAGQPETGAAAEGEG